MTSSAPGRSPARGAPLVTAELPPDVFAWADRLRRENYPPERIRLGAHVTLLHALPPSSRAEVKKALGELARAPAPEARIVGLMDLGRGTALALASPALEALHAQLAELLHGLIQQRDQHPFRPHITVQNKVSRPEAQALQAVLSQSLQPRAFRFRGLGLHEWRDEMWRFVRLFPFREGGKRT